MYKNNFVLEDSPAISYFQEMNGYAEMCSVKILTQKNVHGTQQKMYFSA